MVGAEGFEPPTLCSQSRCATRLRYAPPRNRPGARTRQRARVRPARDRQSYGPCPDPSNRLAPRPRGRARIIGFKPRFELQGDPTVTAKILDGKAISQALKAKVRAETDALSQRGARRPGLAVVLVGQDPASEIYVRNKRRSCEETGIVSVAHDLPATTSEATLTSEVKFHKE